MQRGGAIFSHINIIIHKRHKPYTCTTGTDNRHAYIHNNIQQDDQPRGGLIGVSAGGIFKLFFFSRTSVNSSLVRRFVTPKDWTTGRFKKLISPVGYILLSSQVAYIKYLNIITGWYEVSYFLTPYLLTISNGVFLSRIFTMKTCVRKVTHIVYRISTTTKKRISKSSILVDRCVRHSATGGISVRYTHNTRII